MIKALMNLLKKIIYKDECEFPKGIIKVKLISENAVIPRKQHINDAAYDLYSTVELYIKPQDYNTIFFDIAIEIPNNMKGIISGRSSMQSNGIFCQIGTIDPNYRGNIGCTLYNANYEAYHVSKGDRIAQLSFEYIPQTIFVEDDKLSESERGNNGYGSTGK